MRTFVCLLIAVSPALSQSRVSQDGPHRMEITLERHESGNWRVIDPGLVLGKNDRVRFRFRANFDGFLYVTNHSTSGTSTLLFPRQDTGTENRVLGGKEYLVPATSGAFRVDGPAGFDVVSWTVSPVELGRTVAVPYQAPIPPANMKPRCDDALFRSRGDCIDTSAGARGNDNSPKDLIVIREKKSSVVSSPAPLKGPVTYEFRLAHN